MKKRLLTMIQWRCKAWITDLEKDPDHFKGKCMPESVYIENFIVESANDRCGWLIHNKAALGKYCLRLSLKVFGNGGCVRIEERVMRRLQPLLDAKILSGIYSEYNGREIVAYFNPSRSEHFTRTALKVAAEIFKAFKISKYDWHDFKVSQKTEFKPPQNKYWIDYSEYLKMENQDILGKMPKNN